MKIQTFALMVLTLTLSQGALASSPLVREVITYTQTGTEKFLGNSFLQSAYVFDPDQAAGKPTCAARCAEVWPPMTVTDAEAAGITDPNLSTVKRETGLNQLTLKGRPLYLFHLDRKAGDILGDGLGNVWHVVRLE